MRQSFLQLLGVLFFYSFLKSPKKNIVLLVALENTCSCICKLYIPVRHIVPQSYILFGFLQMFYLSTHLIMLFSTTFTGTQLTLNQLFLKLGICICQCQIFQENQFI